MALFTLCTYRFFLLHVGVFFLTCFVLLICAAIRKFCNQFKKLKAIKTAERRADVVRPFSFSLLCQYKLLFTLLM